MFNPYVTSALSVRCKGPLSYSFNDYYSFPTEYGSACSLIASSYCCCASNYVHRVFPYPRFSYGSRQSSLIHWSASRRLVVGWSDPNPYPCRVSRHNSDHKCCCGHVSGVKGQKDLGGERRKLGEGRFRPMASDRRSCDYENAEMMISLMIEEVGEECYGVRGSNYRLSRRDKEEKKANESGTSYGAEKKKVGSDFTGSKLKRESLRIKLGEEDTSRHNKDRERGEENTNLQVEKQRGRRTESSCSSYYTCSSLGELDSDSEVQIRNEVHREESGSRYKRDLKESEKVYCDEEIKEDVKRHENVLRTHNAFESGWRKKSEKKLHEESAEELLTEKSSQNQNRLSNVHETGHHQGSSSRKQFSSTENDSTLSIISGELRQSQKIDQVVGEYESRLKQKQLSERNCAQESDIDIASSSRKQLTGREEKSTEAGSLILGKKLVKMDDRSRQTDDYRASSKQSDQVSQTTDINVQRTNFSKTHSVSSDNRKDRSSVISGSAKETESHCYLTSEEDLRQMDSRRKFRQSTEESAKEQHVHTGQQSVRKTDSANAQVTNIRRTSENRVSSQETHSAVVIESAEETRKRTEFGENRVLRIGPAQESEGAAHQASTSGASSILETTPKLPPNGTKTGDESYSKAIVVAPESPISGRNSQSEFSNDVLCTKPLLDAPLLQHEILEGSTMGQDQTSEVSLTTNFHDDALGSAHRFQQSSSKVVGEFLEKVMHEASASEEQKEKRTSLEGMVIEGHKHEEKSLGEYYVDLKSKEQHSSRSSQSSRIKGPSDEIWDEEGTSAQDFVDTQTQVPEKTSLNKDMVIKRTGRSMWNIFSDIFRLQWGPRSKTHDSTPESDVKNSPNRSTSSEAWFSGREREEASEENIKRGKNNTSRESVPTSTESQGEGYSSSFSKDKTGITGVDAATPSSKTPIVSTTTGASSSVSPNKNFKRGGSTLLESSVSMPSLHIQRSPHDDEVSEFNKTTAVSASGSLTRKETVFGSWLSNVPLPEGEVGGMKKRMLQRSNQVIKDRFEEWEEAFTHETEQRKIDEAFMKEALLEAKKAGDMWEVPVGAVLVHHGKIIARGYNLVEELRDSTAHAEMICIREASNQLRTWRLAETTLYVTLEPCPMCAGAILQARIDAVVWGAPNKLLGADGSWIRLFPDGGEGESVSDLADKPPAPVHPFHPKIAIRRGVLGPECADVMQEFFQLRRRKKEKKQLTEMPPMPASCPPISNHRTKIFTKVHDAFHFLFCL